MNNRIKFFFPLLCLAALLATHCAGRESHQTLRPTENLKITLEHPSSVEDLYVGKKDDCEIRWTLYKGVNAGVSRFRFNCDAPRTVRFSLMDRMLQHFKSIHSGQIPFHTLTQGRLLHDEGLGLGILSARLAHAALESPGWDSLKGQPQNGHSNTTVKTLLNQDSIYREYRELFARHGLDLAVSGVEKVLITKVATLPPDVSGKTPKQKRQAHVPYDCLFWFSVAPRPTPTQGAGD